MNVFAELPEPDIARDALLLEQTGYTREEAERMALDDAVVHTTASAGAMYLALNPAELTRVWNQALRAGARTVTLNIRAEGDSVEEYTGHISVLVLENDPWPEHDTGVSRIWEATRTSSATPESRHAALARIRVRHAELLRELAELAEMTAGHEEALGNNWTAPSMQSVVRAQGFTLVRDSWRRCCSRPGRTASRSRPSRGPDDSSARR